MVSTHYRIVKPHQRLSIPPPWPESIIAFADLLAMSHDSTRASHRLQMGIKWAKENGLTRKYSE